MAITETAGVAVQKGNAFFKNGANANLETFIPELWSAQLILDTEAELILSSAALTNRMYEGEIQNQGDTVRIPHYVTGNAVVNESYDPYSTLPAPDVAQVDHLLLRVNQARTFHFEVDDLHAAQTGEGVSLMDGLIRDHARALAESMDRFIAMTIKMAIQGKDHNNGDLGLHGKVSLVAPVVNPGDLYQRLVTMRMYLDINNVPTSGRYLIVGPSEYAQLLNDEHFIDASRYGAGSLGGGSPVLINGEVGKILGLSVVVSNTIGSHLTDATLKLLPGVAGATGVRKMNSGGDKLQMIVGHSQAITFASQLTRMAAYQPQEKFTNAVKALYVFGAKVMRPESLVVCGDATLSTAP